MKKIVESDIRWRGSVTDLATDCAYLLTVEEGVQLAKELLRFAGSPKVSSEKYHARGRQELPSPSEDGETG